VADLVAVLLPLQRFLRSLPQKLSRNFCNIEEIFPGAAALGAGSLAVKSYRPSLLNED